MPVTKLFKPTYILGRKSAQYLTIPDCKNKGMQCTSVVRGEWSGGGMETFC